ncbi:MAG TPA: LamG-like jellyroll fold domain-containing protein [Verrucomicrobiae bacterium]
MKPPQQFSSARYPLILACSLLLSTLAGMAGTVAYWRFEAGPADAQVSHGGQAAGVFYPGVPDSSGNGNALSVWDDALCGYTYRLDLAETIIPQTGAANSFSVQNSGSWPALFTGSDAMRTLTPSAFTIEVSFKPETGDYRTLVGRDSQGATSFDPNLAALYLQIIPGDAVAIKFCDVSGYWHEAISGPAAVAGFAYPDAATGHWYHMAAVSDGAVLSLYLDAGAGFNLVAQTDMRPSASPNTALIAGLGSGGDWAAGNWSVGRGLYAGAHTDRACGFIDEVRISDRALAPREFLFARRVSILQGPQPTNQVVTLGDPASLSVVAGLGGVGFQWRHTGTNVPGATDATYAIATTTLADSGIYDVVATNSWSSITSSPAVVTVAAGNHWDQQARLAASEGATGAFFGGSVSLSADGNTALVGTHNQTASSNAGQGSAYIYLRNGSNWVEQARLTAADGAEYDYFGSSVSLSEDGKTALVGAYSANTSAGWDAGSAYVFVLNGSSWSQQAKLTAADGAGYDYFGSSVSLSKDGNTALVGADWDTTPAGTGSGSAYVFVRSATSWTQQVQLKAVDGAANDRFGSSVSLSGNGNTALVGAEFDDTPAGANAGSVYVFVRSGTDWIQQARLAAVEAAANDGLGNSVSLSADGNTALAGAYAAELHKGNACVFVRDGANWTQQARLAATGGQADEWFGYSVSLSADGTRALVGASHADALGRVYGFTRTGTNWTQQPRATTEDGAAGDLSGYSVSLSGNGNMALVGAPGADTTAGADAGSAYLFRLTFRPAAPVLSFPVWLTEGVFQFSLTGSPGFPYIIQANTNLVGGVWLSLFTNTSPFTFTDPSAASHSRRFYRGILSE